MDAMLKELGLSEVNSGVCGASWIARPEGKELVSINPSTGSPIATVLQAGPGDYERVVQDAVDAFDVWRMVPPPRRGEVVRELCLELRKKKRALGTLVSLEMGKILPEGEGEVQEMIDMGDFAVGLSRQLYGLTMASERSLHRMFEQWHPLGVVGVLTAFNFPVAVWSWNALVAAVCGDSLVWKPSPETPLCAVAVQKIAHEVFSRHGFPGVSTLLVGDVDPIGKRLVEDSRIPLVSATGSCRMGREVGGAVAARLGRCLLELGGNNAVILAEDADLDLALRGVLFGSVGTSGQRCTTTRRLFVHEGIYDEFVPRLREAYAQVPVGNPLDEGVLMGPLIHGTAIENMVSALQDVVKQGGEILFGGGRIEEGSCAQGYFVEPTLVAARHDMPIVHEETFAPILYVMRYSNLEDVIDQQNAVPQGLSSALFTDSLRVAERFLSPLGSDCGIANVNIGTSGAEIGGAFGGEKDTGGGREAGSDAWKAYMRRQTSTINWGVDLPLAQGIEFGSKSD
jgi:aldehyde dehydrogenase (NAD+)